MMTDKRIDYSDRHTFVVCAYKESPYLSECIESLLSQTVKSDLLISTSTPNGHIYDIAQKYNIRVYVNEGEAGIGNDWNYAIKMAETKYVTVAHQDDIYEPDYAAECIKRADEAEDTIIVFSDYGELRDGKKTDENRLLKVKRLLLFPLKVSFFGKRIFERNRFVRRRILSLGNAICCPSVTFNTEHVKREVFSSPMKSNVDWAAWEEYSKEKGRFVYADKILMYHRIHEDSTTSELIHDDNRTKEDYEMFCKFWPK